MATSSTSSSPLGGGAEDLIIPHHFGQRERHVLLRLVLDDLPHLAGIHRRQLDELGENVEARRADVDVFGLDVLFRQCTSCSAWRMIFSRVASCEPSRPSGLMAKLSSRKPPASLISNSASLRLPAPKSTVKNDLVFSMLFAQLATHKIAGFKLCVWQRVVITVNHRTGQTKIRKNLQRTVKKLASRAAALASSCRAAACHTTLPAAG